MILDALQERDDYADIVGNIIVIAAGWEKFELSNDEYQALSGEGQGSRNLGRTSTVRGTEETARKDAARQEQEREYLSARKRELELLLAMFDEFALPDQNAQKRGYLLQDLLNRLFAASEIPVHGSFTRNDGG